MRGEAAHEFEHGDQRGRDERDLQLSAAGPVVVIVVGAAHFLRAFTASATSIAPKVRKVRDSARRDHRWIVVPAAAAAGAVRGTTRGTAAAYSSKSAPNVARR